MRFRRLSASLVGAILLAFSSDALAAAAQSVEREPSTFLTVLVGWSPIVLLIVLWIWFMRRIGANKNSAYIDRGLVHMNRVEEQNDQIIAALDRIEKALGRHG